MSEIESNNNPILSPAQLALAKLKAEAGLQKQSSTGLALMANRLSLCVDTSSSMGIAFGKDNRCAAAKLAMNKIISASNSKETNYSLVVFNHESHLIHPQGTGFAKFFATTFYPAGGTALHFGIDQSLSQNPTRIIALTDGETDQTSAFAAAERCLAKSVKIDAIAIGEASDDFLQKLASMTGGRFSRASTPEELEKVFLQLEPKNYLLLEGK